MAKKSPAKKGSSTLMVGGAVAALISILFMFHSSEVAKDVAVTPSGPKEVRPLTKKFKTSTDVRNALLDMKENPKDRKIQSGVLEGLTSMCANNLENQEMIASMGGVAQTVALLKSSLKQRRLQQQALILINYLSANEANIQVIHEEGGIQRIIAAMKEYKKDQMIQDIGCYTLYLLGFAPKAKELIGKENGVPTILAAMKNFAGNAKIQEKALMALSILGKHSDANALRIGKEGGLQLIMAAIADFTKRSKSKYDWPEEDDRGKEKLSGEQKTAQMVKDHGCMALLVSAKANPENQKILNQGNADELCKEFWK